MFLLPKAEFFDSAQLHLSDKGYCFFRELGAIEMIPLWYVAACYFSFQQKRQTQDMMYVLLVFFFQNFSEQKSGIEGVSTSGHPKMSEGDSDVRSAETAVVLVS